MVALTNTLLFTNLDSFWCKFLQAKRLRFNFY